MISTKAQAIQTALHGDWDSAIALNREVLKESPNDIETLNRLAFAFSSAGKTKDARETYKKVLALDIKNPIALKNLKRLAEITAAKNANNGSVAQSPIEYTNSMFLEEDGKTKVVELVNEANPKLISLLRTGEYLTLQIKRLKIFVLDAQKEYIGMLPDDIAKRLIRFMNGGNSYEAYVKAVTNHRVSVFVKETKRATKFKNHPSFITQHKTKNAFTPHGRHAYPSREADPVVETGAEAEPEEES